MTKMQKLGLDKWTAEERLKLIGELWESLSNENDEFPLTAEQEEDLRQRLEEDDADPDAGYTLEEVKETFRKPM